VIPAFNEATSVGAVVSQAVSSVDEVVVVDDGSNDDTGVTALKAGASVIRHEVNLGQGAALQTGIDYARVAGATHVVTFDADGQHRIEDALRMIQRLDDEGLDVVLGTRGKKRQYGMPMLRHFLIRAGLLMTRATTGLSLTDTHNGLRAFTAEAAGRLDLTQSRMAHASEIIERIAALNLKWAEEPVVVTYSEYALSKGQSNLAAIRIMFDWLSAKLGRTGDRKMVRTVRKRAIESVLKPGLFPDSKMACLKAGSISTPE
jgi:glycosyltransferase involved in cell wall biosynthesis